MKPASLLFSISFYSRAVTSGSSVIILGEVYPLPFGAWSSGLGVVAISAGGSADTYFILLGFFAAYLLIFVFILRKFK